VRAQKLVALAAVASLGACCTPAFVAQRPYPAPDAQVLLRELRQRQQVVRGADLETRAESWLGGQRTKATVLMLVERGGRLRFEAEVALQGAVASLVTDGGNFAFLDLQQQVFKQGPACPDNVASLIPVPLQPAEIAAILLGDAPLGPDARVVGLEWDGKRAADVLVIDNARAGSAVTSGLWVAFKPGKPGAPWDIVGVEASSAGADPKHRWRVAYDDLKTPGGADPAGRYSFPDTIRFAEPGRDFDDGVEIVVKDRKLNPSFRPQAFQLSPPEGYQVQTVPCCPGCAAR
jgi:hypothetical protein